MTINPKFTAASVFQWPRGASYSNFKRVYGREQCKPYQCLACSSWHEDVRKAGSRKLKPLTFTLFICGQTCKHISQGQV